MDTQVKRDATKYRVLFEAEKALLEIEKATCERLLAALENIPDVALCDHDWDHYGCWPCEVKRVIKETRERDTI